MVDIKENKLFTLNFFLACIASFMMGFAFYLLIPTLPFYLVQKYEADKAVVGIVMSSYVVAALLSRPFSGYVVDTFNRKMVYLLSFFIFVFLTGGYLITATLALLFVLRFVHGLAWGVLTTAGSTLAIDIMPSSRRGEGIGLYGLALPLSMSIGPMTGLFLFDHYSFDVIFMVATFIGFLGLVAAFFIVVPPKQHHHAPILSLDRFFMVKGVTLGLNMAVISFTYGVLLAFAAMFGKEQNIQNTGWFFTLLAIGMVVSRTFSGKLIDMGRLRGVTIFASFAVIVGFILLAISQESYLYFGSSIFIGIGYGVLSPAIQTMFIGIGNHHQRGTANSTFLTAFDLGVGLGMVGAGKLAEVTSLSFAFGFNVVVSIISLFLLMKITLPYYYKHKLEDN